VQQGIVGRTTPLLSAGRGYGRAPVGGQGKRCRPYRPERPAGRPAQSEPDPRHRQGDPAVLIRRAAMSRPAASPFTEAISVANACALTTLQMPTATPKSCRRAVGAAPAADTGREGEKNKRADHPIGPFA